MYFQWWKRKSERNLFHSHRMSRQGRIIFWFLCSRVRITKIIGCIGYILSTFKGLVFVVFSLWRKVGNQLHKIALIYEIQDFQVLTVVHPLYLTPLINAHQVRIFITKVIRHNFITFIADVCWLRLDFESFTLQGVADTQELNGGVCLDSFSVSVCIYLNECHFSFIVLVIFSVKYWSTSSCHLRAKYWSTQ